MSKRLTEYTISNHIERLRQDVDNLQQAMAAHQEVLAELRDVVAPIPDALIAEDRAQGIVTGRSPAVLASASTSLSLRGFRP